MAKTISSGGVVRCCSSPAVPFVRRCSGLVDVAPELFWDCTGECAALCTISTDLIVSTGMWENHSSMGNYKPILHYFSLNFLGGFSSLSILLL